MKSLKLPAFPKLKLRKPKKLRATAVRRPLRIAATAEYDELAEPNMKLSRALLIVLLLHVVAVSGIIAFNAIKTRQGPLPAIHSRTTASGSAASPAATPSQSASVPHAVAASGKSDEAKAPKAIKVTSKEDHKKAADSGKTYLVAKGDTPVSIARKLKVSYDDLLALNHIDDPRKLHPGQKLLIPSKSTKTKKTDE